jgi:hypothetical protein
MRTLTFLLLIILALVIQSCMFRNNGTHTSGGNDLKIIRNEILKKKKHVLLSDNGQVVKQKFIPLSPGCIKPEGWIKDWSELALNGITGHLDEWSPTFGEAWMGHGFKATGADSIDGTGWPLEQSSYWLDGAVRLAFIMNDSALIEKVSKRLNRVVDGVLNGGETFIYWKPKDFIAKDGFNSWAHSHIGRALVAYYQATGDQRILDALTKVYSQYKLPELPDHFNDVTGAVNADPMLETYLISGNKQILERVLALSKLQSFNEVTSKWKNGEIKTGHGVINYENIRVPSLLYPWTGEQSYLDATKACFTWLENYHILPYGIASSEEYNAGIGSNRNTETCNVAASMWSYLSMLEITGNNSWADRIERVFFNAAPVPVARDFKTMCYYQSPNRIGSLIPGEFPTAPTECGGDSPYVFCPLGHKVLCCVGNVNRVIPNYIMHLWMATVDDGLAAVLYGPSTLNCMAGKDVPVQITTRTNYPFDETINMRIDVEKKVNFPLYLKIPNWCINPLLKVNNETIKLISNTDGFVKIDREWEKGDSINLYFPMKLKLISGFETSFPQIKYFLNDRGRKVAKLTDIHNPYQCLYYGPLLFALPIEDVDANTPKENQSWNYALAVKEETLDQKVEVVKTAMPDHWSWQLDAPVKLKVGTKKFDWSPSDIQALPKHTVNGGIPSVSILVPYGCTKFRVSMFPVSE